MPGKAHWPPHWNLPGQSRPFDGAAPAAGGAGADNGAEMMKHLKTCCFLGLALLLLTLPVRGAELPPEVERALPREAGQLLKDVDHWT